MPDCRCQGDGYMDCLDITYDKYGRMAYHPEFHSNHGKPLNETDIEYLCKYWEIDGAKTMSFALGKTEHTLSCKINQLRKQGLFEYYKTLNKYW